MSVFLIFITVCYGVLIVSLVIGFHKVKVFSADKTNPKTKFSIVIPFRNEAENLPVLLQSISELEYAKELYEFIFVNDDSDDDSVEVIDKCQVERSRDLSRPFDSAQGNIRIIKNIRFSNSPKKNAITTAINQTKNNWIITTDADCKLPKKWLQTLDCFIQQKNPNMVVGGVNYEVSNSFLQRFQLLDFLSLQGTTIGGFGLKNPFLCNGANLAYKKSVFKELNGFEGNNHIASGDDVFLFEKFLKFDKKSVQFLKSKDVIVTTFPVNSWKDLVHQRVRWASKSSQVSLPTVKLVGLLVFVVNATLLLTLVLGAVQILSLTYFFNLFVFKFLIDLLLFVPTIQYYHQTKNFVKSYILSSILYPVFSVSVVVYSLFFKFSWKGRDFKK